MNQVHTLPSGTMPAAAPSVLGAALLSAGIGHAAFDFDLPVKIADVKNIELRNRVLSRLAFACDAYIGITIQRALTTMREERETDGTQRWDTYQAFLHYASGIAASEEIMVEAGMEVTPMRETVQKLFNCRTQVHSILAESIGASYEVPVITDWMRNPRVRRDDATTLRKLHSAAKNAATDEDGAIDVDLEKQMLESLNAKRTILKQDQLKWDVQRGELAATMFDALKIRDDVADTGFAGDQEEPFLELSAELQLRLLRGAVRYVQDTLTSMIDDRKITFEDHAAASIESRPLIKAIKLACEHKRFADIDV